MAYRKRTYKDVTDQRILDIWEEVKEEARSLYPHHFDFCEPELYQDNSYAHLGLCVQEIANPSVKIVDKIMQNRCIILVSAKLGQDYDQIRRTLCHELGHFVAPRENHSYLWETRANKIGQRWGCKASRCTSNKTFNDAARQAREQRKQNTEYKYRVYCPDCGAEWKYKSNCKVVQRFDKYRCSRCKSSLELEKF